MAVEASIDRPAGAPLTRPEGPSPTQREAIEAPIGPVLVLAGPGAGKTYCLAERIRHLIEVKGAAPGRICAFTFTNKAAGEIGTRLALHLGERASSVKGGTIHAFCSELLREFGTKVGLKAGFGIADEEYQYAALRRIGVATRWHKYVIRQFVEHRFHGAELEARDQERLDDYERFLARRNMVDYDTLVIKAAEVLSSHAEAADEVRSRFDHVLVDEFQDLNRKQYAIIKSLAWRHKSIFAVGDDEQSIYSWAGADPRVFTLYATEFGITNPVYLRDKRRCPRQVFAYARRLVEYNPSLFTSRLHANPDRESAFPVVVHTFETEREEMEWIASDLRDDRDRHALQWGDIALLYRTNRIGDQAETMFLNAAIPVRLARGRSLSEDPVVAYVIAALRVIATPGDRLHKENFLTVVLPRTLVDSARASAEENGEQVLDRFQRMADVLPKENADGRKIRRGLSALRNLAALGTRFTSITPLVSELLSQRVGEYRSLLDEIHHDLTDPSDHPDVVVLARSIQEAIDQKRPIRIARLGGMEIAMKALLAGIGADRVDLGGPPPDAQVFSLAGTETPALGPMLGLFKAAQLISSAGLTNVFKDFTSVDIETTGRDTATTQIVEIAAVRVRDGQVAAEYRTLVRPRVAIEPGATATHGITEAEVATAPFFEQIWPAFIEFCGRDVLIAHNGNQFDFPVIRRLAAELSLEGARELTTYDTLPLARELRSGSAKLEDLARTFLIDAGQSHRALDDTRTLAKVFLALNDAKLVRARKTALATYLDRLAIGLALSNDATLGEEGLMLKKLTRSYALSRYTEIREYYRDERERGDDHSIPPLTEVIDLLGGEEKMNALQTDRGAEERYPQAMSRMRGLLERCATVGSLPEQIAAFLEKAALSSRPDGAEPANERVNLLTLHSTKGLEFSRVYIIGAEDSQLIGGSPSKPASREEVEEARRLLYVGMTRTKERLVMTRVLRREGEPTGGHQFLDEMGIVPTLPG
ncbi:MAG TPA: UvrD-helicase domain-containing protein [Candidatus Dormibacteraeota bacterium]